MSAEHAMILVVDDEADERELLAGVLTRAGHAVQCADSAASALGSIDPASPPDLILLDLGMPRTGGIDLLARLRQDARTAAVPVIVVSGQHDVSKRVESLDAGANDYITKPVHAAELVARARTLLRASDQLDRVRRGTFLDSMTGLLNRPGLAHLLGLQVEQSRRHHGALAVLFLDLDGFKAVNDQCGHLVGDRILCDVAQALQAQLRSTDFAARWGGDEFVVVLPAADPQMVTSVVARLEAAITALAPTDVAFGVSIGVASLYEDVAPEGDIAHRLIECADEAMYRVKQRHHAAP